MVDFFKRTPVVVMTANAQKEIDEEYKKMDSMIIFLSQ